MEVSQLFIPWTNIPICFSSNNIACSKDVSHFHFLQARTVAAATQTLCDAANAAVQGNASEERLIAGANQVASSTAQLLLACRVKADANSATQKRLQVRRSCDEMQFSPNILYEVFGRKCKPIILGCNA